MTKFYSYFPINCSKKGSKINTNIRGYCSLLYLVAELLHINLTYQNQLLNISIHLVITRFIYVFVYKIFNFFINLIHTTNIYTGFKGIYEYFFYCTLWKSKFC